jgi:enolase
LLADATKESKVPVIRSIKAREILDSRSNPTIEVEVTTDNGHTGLASVPSGASTGTHEAHELRDGDPDRYRGKGVRQAVDNVTGPIAAALAGLRVEQQGAIDQALIDLDGTPDKSRLGANAILGVSLACARAAAASAGVPLYRHLGVDQHTLPMPMFNILNGGRHAAGSTDFQEFMVVPVGMPTFAEALRAASEVFQALRDELADRGLATTQGDEGGFAPLLPSNEAAIEVVVRGIERAGFRPAEDVSVALDPAVSEIVEGGPDADGQYHYRLAREGRSLTSTQLIDLWADWLGRFPIVMIEDGLAEDDWDGWRQLTARLGKRVQILGDDIFVTNPERLARGLAEHSANAILIKLNQIGTLTEALDVARTAVQAGWGAMVSHRSGETEDTFIADFAVGAGIPQIKSGAPSRSERVSMYNRLLRIEEELGAEARLASWSGARAVGG